MKHEVLESNPGVLKCSISAMDIQ